MLAPDFLKEITDPNREIDQSFIDKIAILDKKLNIFNSQSLPESKSIKEVKPEIKKTLAKVSDKIYRHVIGKLSLMNKANTDIQVLQESVIMKTSPLVAFLKNNYQVMYNDILEKYVAQMALIYTQMTTKYTHELLKLLNDKQEKFNLLNLEEHFKDVSLVINKRKTILNNIKSDPIFPYLFAQKKQTLFFEEAFRSLNRFQIDAVTSETIFCHEFFDTNIDGMKKYIDAIFEQSTGHLIEMIRDVIVRKCNDIFGISLMLIINSRQQEMMHDRKLDHLEVYFNELNAILWPKFDYIFQAHVESLFTINFKSNKEDGDGIHIVTLKLLFNKTG